MAGKSKSYYIDVMEGYKTIVKKVALNAKDANKIYEELKEKYPPPQYLVFKEYY